MTARNTQIAEQLTHLAAQFFARESNRESLITVTRARMSENMRSATIFFTVLPADHETGALSFAKRQRSEFRTYVKEHSALGNPPSLDFEIDVGEKLRQEVDDILRQSTNDKKRS